MVPRTKKDPNYDYAEANYKPEPHLCPVCGKYTFEDRGSFDICPYRGWEDDDVVGDIPDVFDVTPNDLCLEEFKERYKKLVEKKPDYKYSRDGKKISD